MAKSGHFGCIGASICVLPTKKPWRSATSECPPSLFHAKAVLWIFHGLHVARIFFDVGPPRDSLIVRYAFRSGHRLNFKSIKARACIVTCLLFASRQGGE